MADEIAGYREIVLDDAEHACSYLPEEVARLPLRWPMAPLSPTRLDEVLASGSRRTGSFLYGIECAACKACEALRLDVSTFTQNRSQRRVFKRCQDVVELRYQTPIVDDRRVELYNKHRFERGLAKSDSPIDEPSYQQFLVDTCCDSIEIGMYLDGRLIGVGITDRGASAISAVYFYFDPDYSKWSLGVFNVLHQVELGRKWGMRYVYLGYYIGACRHMAYKSNYQPHERLIDGEWRSFGLPENH